MAVLADAKVTDRPESAVAIKGIGVADIPESLGSAKVITCGSLPIWAVIADAAVAGPEVAKVASTTLRTYLPAVVGPVASVAPVAPGISSQELATVELQTCH
jgi:hypothetical protein